MFNPDYMEVQWGVCSACSVCTVCATCSVCAGCLIDGPVPDAEVGAVGTLGLVGRAVSVASW